MSKRRVLIVEDEERWQMMLSSALTRAGCQVQQARHHGEALSLIQEHGVDLAIVDLRLQGSIPQWGFEGQSVLDALKEMSILSIVVSARLTPEINKKLMEDYGPYGLVRLVDKLRFVEESYLHGEFMTLVNEALARSEHAERADGLADDQLDRLAQPPPART